MPSSPATPDAGPGLPELVLRAAHDLTRVDTAFDAELLLSALLGGVYAGTLPDRGQSLAAFVEAFDAHLSRAGTDVARVARAVLAALTPPVPDGADGPPAPEGADGAGRPDGAEGPPWLGELGAVRATGGWAYGDRYGDQTSYLVTFAYRDGSAGGPEHAVIVLVDHNLGLVKDLVVAAPAGPALDRLRESVLVDPDAMTWLAEVDPATVRAAATGYLRATDNAPDLPGSAGLLENRALVAARLAALPGMRPEPAGPAGGAAPTREAGSADSGGSERSAGGEAGATGGATDAAGSAGEVVPADDRAALVAQFLQSPEARLSGLAGAAGQRGEAVTYGLGLIVDFAEARGGDPLRWSPRAVEVFLLDWVHGRALLDADDARSLPDALGAWVLWSGRLLGLPDVAVQATFDEVGTRRAEFVRLCTTGERQTPAVKAMRRLLADAVDVTDDAAVDAWLRAHEREG
jgi:hypothetical protein